MRKARNIISIITMCAMFLSTMGLGVFATDEILPATDESIEGQQIEETIAQGTENTESTEELGNENGTGEIEEPTEESTEDPIVEPPEEPEVPKVVLPPIKVSAVSKSATIDLSWIALSGQTYMVYQKVSEGGVYVEKPITTSALTSTAYRVTRDGYGKSLVNGRTYIFVVKTVEKEGYEITSGEISAVPNAKITSLAAFAGYKSVHLEWKPVSGAKSYKVIRNNGSKVFSVAQPASGTSLVLFKDNNDKAIDGSKGLHWDKTYSYKVVPVYGSNCVGENSNIVSKACVRPMYIKVTFNKKRTLKSHDGKKIKRTFKKGYVAYAWGFTSGTYKFYDKGVYFRVNKNSTYKTGKKKRKCVYSKKANYSIKDANYFINDLCPKTTSEGAHGSSWLLWTSFNSQHVYVFRDKGDRWVCNGKNWECATGKANSPSPTGNKYYVHNKVKSRHGLPTWTCWQSWNAFHGKFKNWKVGKPASGGCFRNDNANAKYVYKNVPKRTRVVAY